MNPATVSFFNEIKCIQPLSHQEIVEYHKAGDVGSIVYHFQPFLYAICCRYSSIYKKSVLEFIGPASMGLYNWLKARDPDKTFVGSVTNYCYRFITAEILTQCLFDSGSNRYHHEHKWTCVFVYDEDKLQWDGDNIIDDINKAFEAEYIVTLLDILKPEERVIIDGLFYNKKTQEQIAAEQNVSPSTIRKRKVAALNKLLTFYVQYQEAYLYLWCIENGITLQWLTGSNS